MPVLTVAAALTMTAVLALTGRLSLDPVTLAAGASWVIALFAAAHFGYLIVFARLNADERKRVLVICALFCAYATFYAGFEQGGASLNLFAERYTDRYLLGWEMPAGSRANTMRTICRPCRRCF